MVEDAPSKGGPLTIGQDARVTRVGRILRRYKLDELPQLLNILKGDMSVVGPRPEVQRYVELFRTDYSEILAVRPGLTDLASIKYIDEAAILDRATSPEEEYQKNILPEKIRLAKLYVRACVLPPRPWRSSLKPYCASSVCHSSSVSCRGLHIRFQRITANRCEDASLHPEMATTPDRHS